MLLTIIVAVLVLLVAFFQVIQGMFSALIMAILTILCAMLGFAYYDTLSVAAFSGGALAPVGQGASLALLFGVPLLVLRFACDALIKSNVVSGVWADRIGGGLFGLVTAIVIVGVLVVAIQMLPFPGAVLGYERYDQALQVKQQLPPFYPDDFLLKLVRHLSAGPMKGRRDFGATHSDLLKELYCARLRASSATPPTADAAAIESAAYFEGAGAFWAGDLPADPSAKPVVVQAILAETAKDTDGQYRPLGPHFRLVATDAKTGDRVDYYPVAYLKARYPGWDVVQPQKKGEGAEAVPDLVGLVHAVDRSADDKVAVDWVYLVPQGHTPVELVYRGAGKTDLKRTEPSAAVAIFKPKVVEVGPVAGVDPIDLPPDEFLDKVRTFAAANPTDLDRCDPQSKKSWLHLACVRGQIPAVNFLLGKGADPNAPTADEHQYTALHLAVLEGQLDVVRLLLGSRVGLRVDVNKPDRHGNTPLHLAVQRKEPVRVESSSRERKTIVELLLEANANRNARNSDDNTPLHLVARGDAAAALLGPGNEVLVDDINARNKDGNTPLHMAAGADVARELIRRNADVTAVNKKTETALHLAKDGDMAEELLRTDPGLLNKPTETGLGLYPIHTAANDGVVEALLRDRGNRDTPLRANPQQLTTRGRYTPLHIAAQDGRLKAAEALFREVLYVNVEAENKQTPLHLAAMKGHGEVSAFLVSKGANYRAKDADGKTPLDLAREKGYEAIVAMFQAAAAKETPATRAAPP